MTVGICSLLITIAVGGSLLYYANISAEINVNAMLEIDGQPMENQVLQTSLSGYGGDINVSEYQLFSHRDNNVSFIIDSLDINTVVTYQDQPVIWLDMIAETPYNINVTYTIPYNLTSGKYWSNISIYPTP